MAVQTKDLPFQKFEMDNSGAFRIGILRADGEYEWGSWVSYRGIARVVVENQLFIGVSAYHEGIMPIEQAQLVTPLPTKES